MAEILSHTATLDMNVVTAARRPAAHERSSREEKLEASENLPAVGCGWSSPT
jgi:hypothetical protein